MRTNGGLAPASAVDEKHDEKERKAAEDDVCDVAEVACGGV